VRLLAFPVLVAAGLVIVVAGPARAGVDVDDVDRAAQQTIRRARRAVALGPHVGLSGALAEGDSFDGAISVGLALSLFDVPVVPDAETIDAIVTEHAKERLTALIEQAAAEGRPLGEADVRAEAARIYRAVVDEYFAERRPRTLERPRARLLIEAARTFDAGDWSARLGAGLGIGPVSVGASVTTVFGDDMTVYLGPDISLQVLPRESPRSPIIDGFVRGDFAVTGDGPSWLAGAGVRVILDVI